MSIIKFLVIPFLLLTFNYCEEYSSKELRNLSIPATPILTQEDAVSFALHINKDFHNVVHEYDVDYWEVSSHLKNEVWTVSFKSRYMRLFSGNFQFNKNGKVLVQKVKTRIIK